MTFKEKRGQIGWAILLLLFAFLFMVPLIFMISMSLRTPDTIGLPKLFIADITFKNYQNVFAKNPQLPGNFLGSVIVTVSSVALVAICSSMAVFGFSRKNVHGKVLIYNILLCTLMVPLAGLVVPLTQLNSKLGWINNYMGLILPYTALGIPYAITILQGFMIGIPKELEEAAVIDGCGLMRLFMQIVCPLLKPGIVVIVIWQFLTSWNEFFLAMCTLTDEAKKTLPLVAQQYNGAYFSQPGTLFAALTLITIPMLVFYVLVQKQFVKGLTAGAVKG
ncbi:MAG TPA: carbohydrate ABC transporter permease [Candidatus Pelethocola excrementipullorum]|nr:carbohydrate ABC transporter permease [Candidatus Pelethocola excrementipullorum]